MIRFRTSTAILLTALTLTACGKSGPPTVGETKPFAQVCDKSNDGKRIAVDGYLRFPSSFTKSSSVVLRFYENGNFKGNPIGVQMNTGTQPNQVEEVQKQFVDSDLKVHLANGQIAPFGTKVKVSGTVYFPMVEQEFPCSFETPLIEPSN